MTTLPPGVKPYERPKFTKTRRQILNAIPVGGIEECLLALTLNVSLVELRHVLKLMAKEKLIRGDYKTEWDGKTLQHLTTWSINCD